MEFIFPQAERADTRLPIIPVFMPFAGCGVRCVFCAQTAQTGKSERQLPVVLDELETTLKDYEASGRGPVEVAFYGGTFTALPMEEQARCLAVTKRWQQKGLVRRVRCSTRPDCITRDIVRFLQDYGVSLIELGVQSFSDRALRASKRNYTGECVENACHLVREQELELGIQLMPGLPNVPGLPNIPSLAHLPEISLEDSYADIARTIAQKPSCVRLYPCLVFEGTPLAAMWRAGEYSPLSLDQTVRLLSYACLVFWQKNIPVIRMGVAPEASAMKNLLAGPFHYSLGNMVRGEALYQWVSRHVAVFRGERDTVWPDFSLGASPGDSSGDSSGDLSGTSSGDSFGASSRASFHQVFDLGLAQAAGSPFGSASGLASGSTSGSASGMASGPASGPTSGLASGLATQQGPPCRLNHPSGHSKSYSSGHLTSHFADHLPDHLPELLPEHPSEHPSGPPLALDVPRPYQGDFWGFKGQLKERYTALGVTKVAFGDFGALRLRQL